MVKLKAVATRVPEVPCTSYSKPVQAYNWIGILQSYSKPIKCGQMANPIPFVAKWPFLFLLRISANTR